MKLKAQQIHRKYESSFPFSHDWSRDFMKQFTPLMLPSSVLTVPSIVCPHHFS
jgi:hypothetical protein